MYDGYIEREQSEHVESNTTAYRHQNHTEDKRSQQITSEYFRKSVTFVAKCRFILCVKHARIVIQVHIILSLISFVHVN